MMKQIKGFEDYYIDRGGKIYSHKNGYLMREIKPWVDSKGRYMIIGLSMNNIVTKKLVHRLVAEAYIPNPNNLPEVNHKDNNPQNNNMDNLEWCDRKYNLYQSYNTMSPVKNFKECEVYCHGRHIDSFTSKEEACKIISKKYFVSYSSLKKYGKSQGYEIVERCND